MAARTIVYSGLGRVMEVFELDLASGALTRVQSFSFAQVIQYAWPNRARTTLYVATSAAGPMAKIKQPHHFVQALEILPTGALAPLAPPVRLANRPLHLSLDRAEAHLLIAYNDPPDVTVHKIVPGGGIGAQVKQQPIDFGVTVHQVRATPSGNHVIVPACAHDKDGIAAGSVGIVSYKDGRLTLQARMVADPRRATPWQGVRHGAQGFAARHVDFHPSRPWMYLCIETQGELRMHHHDETGVSLEPRFIASTLEGTPPGRSAQLASAVHVHPNGRFVYVSNRACETEPFGDMKVFVGGVNDIAVFAIDQTTGEPTLIQHVETHGIFPRTFGIDAFGRVLVVGNQDPAMIRVGDTTQRVVPSLVVFKIGDDGLLTILHKHDHPDNGEVCFWIGVETLPGTGN